MQLKMLTGLGGPGVSLTRGDLHTPPTEEEAVRLVRAGFAATTTEEDAKAVAAAIAELQKAERAEAKAAEAKREKKAPAK